MTVEFDEFRIQFQEETHMSMPADRFQPCMKPPRVFVNLAFAFGLATAVASAQLSRHFEFDQGLPVQSNQSNILHIDSGQGPSFSPGCGSAELRPSTGLNDYFVGFPLSNSAASPGFGIVAECRLRVVAPIAQAGVPERITVFGLWPNNVATDIARCEVAVDVPSGDITLIGGQPAAPIRATDFRTFRLVVSATVPRMASLYVDGVLEVGPLAVMNFGPGCQTIMPLTVRGWAFGQMKPCQTESTGGRIHVDFDYFSVTELSEGTGQANSHCASLFVNRDPTSPIGMPGLRGPFTQILSPGGPAQLEWTGPPFGQFALYAGTLNQAGSPIQGLGISSIGTPPLFGDVSVVLNPFGGLGFFFSLNNCGYATLTLTVPNGIPPGTTLGTIQSVIFSSSGCSTAAALTAALTLTT